MLATQPKQRVQVEFRISDNLRATNTQKQALLNWLNSKPEFKRRRPTIKEILRQVKNPKSGMFGMCMRTDLHEAARHYWKEHAQYILRHIEVVRVKCRITMNTTKPVVAFLPIKIEQNGHIKEKNYIPSQRVAEDPTMKQTIMQRVHNDFQAFLRRWERYEEFMSEFAPVIEAYKKVKK